MSFTENITGTVEKNIQFDSGYIHDNPILQKIYTDAVKKFMGKTGDEICFMPICEYVTAKLAQKKQSIYDHSLNIVKEVCQKVAEDFDGALEYYAPDAKCYRDVYFEIF